MTLPSALPAHSAPEPPRHVAPILIEEFWTSAQRQASSIHEISYRACFKPQVPRYFIHRFSNPDDLVYDPFMGRGTTVIEALLEGRRTIGNDANPLSRILVEPRTNIPDPDLIEKRISGIRLNPRSKADIDLSMFYHPKTEGEIVSLKHYLFERRSSRRFDRIDGWIRMVATNRLTGHSPGFFSVYTLPPNQAASPENQRKINRRLRQRPQYRNVKELVLRKTRRMLAAMHPREFTSLSGTRGRVKLLTGDARSTPTIADSSVALTVTSPPFLDIVNYPADNWLRCWFNDIPVERIASKMTMAKDLGEWRSVMRGVFAELYRITRHAGHVAFEVGELRNKTVRLEEVVIPLGVESGFKAVEVLINQQKFTKTSNIWGIKNNERGTNTNRIVVLKKI